MMPARSFVYVESLIVEQNWRRCGIGRALMEQVHTWALAPGIHEIELNVYEFNQEGIRFYQALGCHNLSRRMQISLPDGDWQSPAP